MDIKNGVIYCTEDEYLEFEEGMEGICIDCGNTQYGCKPDARKYTCEDCENNTVYGLPELLTMGKVIMTEGS